MLILYGGLGGLVTRGPQRGTARIGRLCHNPSRTLFLVLVESGDWRTSGMKKIGVLFGMENSFPGALVEHINARHDEGIQAEFVDTGAVHLNRTPKYAVIVDRISHDIPFYRAFLKHAALHGTIIINNPFWWSADDKFFNYTLAEKLGVAVPLRSFCPTRNIPKAPTNAPCATSNIRS